MKDLKLKKRKLKKNNAIIILLVSLVMTNFLIVKQNYWTIFIILLLFVLLLFAKPNKFQIIFSSIVIVWYVLLCIFLDHKINTTFIFNWLAKNTKLFYVRDQLIEYFEQVYTNKTALSVVKLFILNIKSNEINSMIFQTKYLDILYLFTISGAHVNLILWVVKKAFAKNKIISEITEWTLILSMTYLLKFSIPLLRILFTKAFSYKFKSSEAAAYSGIINCLLFVNIANNFGFILSYGCIFCIYSILKLKIKKYLIVILINVTCSLFSCFILISMNNKVNLFSFIYNICLSPFIMFWYLWIQLTFLMPYLQNAQESIYYFYYYLFNFFVNVDFNIYISSNIKSLFILFYTPFICLWIRN